MKWIFLIIITISPFYLIASFPISYETDTILIDGKKYRSVGVDSLYKFPLPNESLIDYRKRIKEKGIITSNSNDTKTKFKKKRKPITFLQILGIVAIIILIFNIIRVGAAISLLS